MHIGVDFDNTIVCYDALFPRVARESGLVPEGLAANKTAVREYLQRAGREDDWTELQGQVYGARMGEAEAFPGVIDFFKMGRAAGWRMSIVSHKTRWAVRGERHDLQGAAWAWLEAQGFFEPAGAGLTRASVFFELTRAEKLSRIAALGCTHFVDDLPEVFREAAFPKIAPILFDPNGVYVDSEFAREATWAGIGERLRAEPAARFGEFLARAAVSATRRR